MIWVVLALVLFAGFEIGCAVTQSYYRKHGMEHPQVTGTHQPMWWRK